MRYLCLLMLILAQACGPPDHSEMQAILMEKRLDDRINQFIQDEKTKCKVDLMAEASRLADSLLRVSNPVLIQIDSIQKPPRPTKPEAPNFSKPADSVKIAPIIPSKVLEEKK